MEAPLPTGTAMCGSRCMYKLCCILTARYSHRHAVLPIYAILVAQLCHTMKENSNRRIAGKLTVRQGSTTQQLFNTVDIHYSMHIGLCGTPSCASGAAGLAPAQRQLRNAGGLAPGQAGHRRQAAASSCAARASQICQRLPEASQPLQPSRPLPSTPAVTPALYRRARQAPSVCSASADTMQQSSSSPAAGDSQQALLCTSVTATTREAFLAEIQEAASTGVDVVELRLDFLTDFDPPQHLEQIMAACPIPYIVTYRPKWEG
jgi:hypothetical protein